MQADHSRGPPRWRQFSWQGLGAFAFALAPWMADAMPCTNMSLVLAIDGSGSINDHEFSLQLQATARALTHPDVVRAMAELGGVAVATVIWADNAFPPQIIDWERIADRASAERFAVRMAGQMRAVSGNTDIGDGISAALDLIDNPANCATYNVIDVSGDGRETLYSSRRGTSLLQVRARAQDADVTINGLAISSSDSRLVDYYRSHVISGPSAFVMETTSFAGFSHAMQQKLLREVGGYRDRLSADAGHWTNSGEGNRGFTTQIPPGG
jgi:hypothetical protein